MSKKRKDYTDDFKRQAVALLDAGRSAKAISEELGVAVSSLHKWRREGVGGTAKEKSSDLEERNKALQRELLQVRQERDLLKKSIALFVKTGS